VTALLEQPTSATPHPVRSRFGRRKFDKQPTQRAAVLIAAPLGDPVPAAVVRKALARAAGEPVAVVTIARIYGSAMGLPNPGLMPTRKEMAAQKSQVEKTLRLIEKGGGEGWGQVAASRKPVKTIVQAAKARGVREVLVVRPVQTKRWREVVEGDFAKDIARKLGPDITVEGVTP
jgi:hypothetical protein